MFELQFTLNVLKERRHISLKDIYVESGLIKILAKSSWTFRTCNSDSGYFSEIGWKDKHDSKLAHFLF